MKHWTEYRWSEGTEVLNNHLNYQEDLSYHIPVISLKLADYYWKNVDSIRSTNK